MPVIGITGKKRHGKSTVANALAKRGFTVINFADPVRKVVHEVYGVSYEEMSRDDLKEKPLDRWPFRSPRELMKAIGTDMFRTYEPDTWIEWFKRAVRECGNRNVACGDVRFLNEASVITRHFGGCVVRVTDPRRPPPTDEHESEVQMDRIVPRFTLLNHADVASLEQAVWAHFCET